METLKTKSQMIERIAELSEQVENLNRQLDIAIKENQTLFSNASELRRKIAHYMLTESKEWKKFYKRNLDLIIKMSNSEWFDYMYKE